MKRLEEKQRRALRRRLRIRSKISGTIERPRLSVFKSNKHFSAQLIDDAQGHTLAAISTREPALGAKKTVDGVKILGLAFAARLKGKKIETLVFDRAGYPYHGIVKSFAEALRSEGIRF